MMLVKQETGVLSTTYKVLHVWGVEGEEVWKLEMWLQ